MSSIPNNYLKSSGFSVVRSKGFSGTKRRGYHMKFEHTVSVNVFP